MTDLWQRLKQRKLVQWAVAYVAAAFALLQGIDMFAQRFAWPESIERVLLIASCVGCLELFAVINPSLRVGLMDHGWVAR
ncbi:MAG: hypothetical protein ABI365_04000 [Lysobacteraceae bacterium]